MQPQHLALFAILTLTTRVFAAPATQPVSPEPPYRGLSVQIVSAQDMKPYEKCIQEIKDLGADTVDLAFIVHQKNGGSVEVYADEKGTPTPDQVGALIDFGHARQMRVLVKPMLDLDEPRTDLEWRGSIHPDTWDDWFASYQKMITPYVQAAQTHHAEIFCLGTELVTSEQFINSWTALIKAEREIYKGRLTYQSNWDRYWLVPFWDQLDLISMNSYWTLTKKDNPSVDELCEGWKKIKTDLFDWQKLIDKPIFLTEAGWCSLQNAASDPWDYTQTDLPADRELQRRLYEAFFKTWHGTPNCAGYIIWEWAPAGTSDSNGKGYTPRGKLAEGVVKEWMKKVW